MMRNRTIQSLAAAAMCLSVYSAAKQPSIYRKGWIDFNKNGRMDVYENPLCQWTKGSTTCSHG